MSVGDLFYDAQRSTHSHKSLAKRLRKLEAKYIKNNRAEEFEDHVKACVIRLFEVAKSESAGSRTVKFLSTYFASPLNNDKSLEKKSKGVEGEVDTEMVGAEDGIDDQGEDDEQRNAVANAVLVALLPYLSAKDKTVRYRSAQIISAILSSLDAIDDDLYKVIRHELTKRLRDRVPAIRLEAVMVLGPLVEGEIENAETTRLGNAQDKDEDDSDYDEESAQASSLLEKLLDVLCNDTNAEVRRTLLTNLPVTSETLPYLLERARDKDAATRRAFYLKLCLQKLGDFRHLSVSMREKLLRWGLRDRDERVRKAAAKMFREKWIEDCAKSQSRNDENSDEGPKKKHGDGLFEPSIPALLELLERIDVINSGADGGIAFEAMKEFWGGRPDYVDEPTFSDEFWMNLSAESAFMARTWNDFCQSNSEFQELIENRMPEVTRFGFLLQHQMNELTSKIEANKEQEGSEEDTTDQEFIVEQMLHIAHTLDYTDEIGRRKMFGLFRNAITMPDFPDECTKLAIEALRLTCTSDAAGEREFTSVILEAISEVHDSASSTANGPENDDGGEGAEEDSFVSAHSELSNNSGSTATGAHNSETKQLTEEEEDALQLRKILIELKCLNIAYAMLQNVSGHISNNIHLENLLESLILPCVRSHDAPVRERGLECLGLCCLLEPSMAIENWNVFVHCLKRGDENLKVLSVQLLCDLLLTSSRKTLSQDAAIPREHAAKESLEFDISPFVRAFEYGSEVQATATTSLGKLMLCGFYLGHESEFDEAIEQAEGTVKGWEILSKVRTAVRTTDGTITEIVPATTLSSSSGGKQATETGKAKRSSGGASGAEK